jgi:LysR family transcriptional activator of nhaA
MLRLLAREDAGLAVIPSIVVQDELATGTLVLAARIEEMRETFYAITRERRFPNPVLAQLFAKDQPSA